MTEMAEDLERLGRILRRKRPLELHEEGDLRSWLAEIELDCAVLGTTGDDAKLISALRKRLNEKPVIHTPIEPSGKSR